MGRLLQAGQTTQGAGADGPLTTAFGDRLYVELQRHPRDDQAQPEAERLTERPFVEMAYAMDLPLVATNDVYFPKSRMYEAHDALICIAEGPIVDQQEPRRRLTPQHYFKIASRNGGAVRGPAGSDGQHGRNRAALCLARREPRPDPAEVCR